MKLSIIFTLIALAGCGNGGETGSHPIGSTQDALSTFNPTDLSSLSLWLDSNDDATLFTDEACQNSASIDGDSIGCWLDKSGLDHHATIDQVSQKPIYKTGIHLTKSLIQFDGQDDHLDNFYTYNARSVFIVFRIDTSLQETTDLGQLWGNYSEMQVAVEARSGSQNKGLSFDGSGGMRAEYTYDGQNFSGFAENSNEVEWSEDSFNLLSVNFETTGTLNRQVIGSLSPAFAIGTHQFGGQIAEIIVFNDLVSLNDRVKIEGYLACKWGLQGSLTSGHAYRTDCP